MSFKVTKLNQIFWEANIKLYTQIYVCTDEEIRDFEIYLSICQ